MSRLEPGLVFWCGPQGRAANKKVHDHLRATGACAMYNSEAAAGRVPAMPPMDHAYSMVKPNQPHHPPAIHPLPHKMTDQEKKIKHKVTYVPWIYIILALATLGMVGFLLF